MAKRLKTEKELFSLRRGDIIRSVASGNSYVIVYSTGRSMIGIDTVDITNPDEWEAVTIDGKRV